MNISKVGKKPIVIPSGVKVEMVDGRTVKVSGKNATLSVPMLQGIEAKIEGNEIAFTHVGAGKQGLANWGTMRALTANAVKGAEEDFSRSLKIEGVGYRAAVDGDKVTLSVGYSHPVKIDLPEGVKASVEKNILKISGPEKASVGETAARIRKVRKPNPYKGTGIMYTDEVIRRKAGKKVAGK